MIIDFSKYKLEILLFILFFYSLIFCNLSKSRVLFIESNDEASQYFYQEYEVNSNTLLYFSFNNVLTWQWSLNPSVSSSSWTSFVNIKDRKYLQINNWQIIYNHSWYNANDKTIFWRFLFSWTVDSYQWFTLWKDNSWLWRWAEIYWNWSNIWWALATWTSSTSSQWVALTLFNNSWTFTSWKWCFIVITRRNWYWTLYVDWVKIWNTTDAKNYLRTSSQSFIWKMDPHDWFTYNWTFSISWVWVEQWEWTENEVISLYKKQKSLYK